MHAMRRVAGLRAVAMRTSPAPALYTPTAISIGSRYLSSGKPTTVPESFFDEELEAMREQLDVQLAGRKGGVRNITKGFIKDGAGKRAVTINDIEESRILAAIAEGEGDHPTESRDYSLQQHRELAAEEFDDDDEEGEFGEGDDANVEEIDHPVDRYGEDPDYIPPEALNSAVAWKQGQRELEGSEDLKAFVSKTDERSQPFDKQGLVACPGKRQRHGATPVLRCHLIDLDKLSYMDVASLKRFVSADSEIMGKKLTGLCAKCQRKVARTVKRARKLGLMSHLGGFHITDKDPVHEADKFNFHQTPESITPVFSKTIL